MRKVVDKNPVNKGNNWFQEKLREQDKTMRALARRLDADPGNLSRVLAGKRRMKIEEATTIAQFLNAPIEEVLAHAGVKSEAVTNGLASDVVLAATINEIGVVQRMREPKPLPKNVIERARSALRIYGKNNIVAAQFRALEGPLAPFDDAVALFQATDCVEPAAIGVLSICRAYDGEQVLAKIERARKTGEARLILTGGKAKEMTLQTASPILAIIP